MLNCHRVRGAGNRDTPPPQVRILLWVDREKIMKKYLKSKLKYIPGLICLIIEMGISGAYSQLDYLAIITRVGLIFAYISFAAFDMLKAIQWLPLILIALSLMSVRNKWQSIESKKLNTIKSSYTTKIKSPVYPKLPDCKDLKNWRKEICDARIEKLQLEYSKALELYNSQLINSELKSQTATVELTWYDQQPILIYVLLMCGMSWVTLIATPKLGEAKKEIPKQKTDWEKLIKQFIDTKGKTIETYCAENGIAQSTFKRYKKNYETRNKKSETKLRLIEKRGA